MDGGGYLDPVDIKQQQEILDLQSRDLKQAAQLLELDGIVGRMRLRMWVDLLATVLLIALNIALLIYSVEINVTFLPKAEKQAVAKP